MTWRGGGTMVRRQSFWAAVLSGLLVVLAGGCGRQAPAEDRPLTLEQEKEQAIKAAREIYRRAKARGTDFADGPCIADEGIPGWAVDVAHNPRQPVDDRPENQCASFREGRVSHFVELDPDGNLIRAE